MGNMDPKDEEEEIPPPDEAFPPSDIVDKGFGHREDRSLPMYGEDRPRKYDDCDDEK